MLENYRGTVPLTDDQQLALTMGYSAAQYQATVDDGESSARNGDLAFGGVPSVEAVVDNAITVSNARADLAATQSLYSDLGLDGVSIDLPFTKDGQLPPSGAGLSVMMAGSNYLNGGIGGIQSDLGPALIAGGFLAGPITAVGGAVTGSVSFGGASIDTEGFIGPTIGNSGYRTAAEVADAVGTQYQNLYNQAYSATLDDVSDGLVANNNLTIGNRVDALARDGLRDWLQNAEGIQEGPGGIIQVNRQLVDPLGSGQYRIPDVYVPSANTIYDGTIAEKTNLFDQTMDFRNFSSGANITIIRPSTLTTGNATGSYGLYFP